MYQTKSVPHSIDIEHPKCTTCGVLVCIESNKPDNDKRTFECKACGGTRTEIVSYR